MTKKKKEEVLQEEVKPVEAKDFKVTIKKGDVEISTNRSELIDVEPTHDGIVITFKGGLQLYNTEIYMTSQIKNLIKNTIDSYKTGNITIDLNNPRKPVSISL